VVVIASQSDGRWVVDKENFSTTTHNSSITVLSTANGSIFLCLTFFSSPSLFLSLQFVFLFQSASSPSSAFIHWLLSPTAPYHFPCLQLALQITPPTPQHLISYWLTATPLIHSSPTQCNQLTLLWPPYIMEETSTLKTLVTNYLSKQHHIPEDCNLHQQCYKNLTSHYNLFILQKFKSKDLFIFAARM
jgi:hypothetical protein